MQGAGDERTATAEKTGASPGQDDASRVSHLIWRATVIAGFLLFILIDVVIVVVGLSLIAGWPFEVVTRPVLPTARPTRPILLATPLATPGEGLRTPLLSIATPTEGLRTPVPATAAPTFTSVPTWPPTATSTTTPHPSATATPTPLGIIWTKPWLPRAWRYFPVALDEP